MLTRSIEDWSSSLEKHCCPSWHSGVSVGGVASIHKISVEFRLRKGPLLESKLDSMKSSWQLLKWRYVICTVSIVCNKHNQPLTIWTTATNIDPKSSRNRPIIALHLRLNFFSLALCIHVRLFCRPRRLATNLLGYWGNKSRAAILISRQKAEHSDSKSVFHKIFV